MKNNFMGKQLGKCRLKREVVITGDGSPTLYAPELKEHYHSVHGAVQESKFIYIDRAMNRITTRNIFLFEMGFGTGLNALLTCIEAENTKRYICYHSIELYPVGAELLREIGNYLHEVTGRADIFRLISDCEWDREIQATRYFRLKKIKGNITGYITGQKYDVIYFDAFSPDVQPGLWTPEMFSLVAGMMNPGAVLSTYSSKGLVRRNMKEAGLIVEQIPGPPGKREIITAYKPAGNNIPVNNVK
jgi:tRNA U34 5-methylaminomethyl-2-thiouridine-forming methyltransferase MnmC